MFVTKSSEGKMAEMEVVMAVEVGKTCCNCGCVIEGYRASRVFAGHTFKAVEVYRHPFCSDHACNREAWAEFIGKRTAACKCSVKTAKK